MDLFKHTVDLYSLGEAKKTVLSKIQNWRKLKFLKAMKCAGLSIMKNSVRGRNTKTFYVPVSNDGRRIKTI